MKRKKQTIDKDRLDQVVAAARRTAERREQSYREQALKLFPWVCGRCGREFNQGNLHELTVHHRDHDHDNNPPDGSNWELLCVYCHENEHSRLVDSSPGITGNKPPGGDSGATYKPFAGLKDMMKKNK